MKNESTAFTGTDLQGFLDEMIDHDRLALADRLQRASERLAEYGELVTAGHGEQGGAQGGASGAGSARPDAPRGDVSPQMGWYRHVSLCGSVVRFADDTKLADIDRLCLRYTGKPFSNRRAKRVSAWIEPHGWHGWDDEGEVASTSIRT